VNQLLAAALRYAAAGWPVFPCRPGSKKPLTRRGFTDATTDPAVIRAWWARWPDANVAIATGAPGPDVLDVDNGDDSGWSAFNRLQRRGLLAGAFAFVRTRSGGLHAYYAGTGQRCTAKIGGAALDYRAAGGYVLAPPSYVDADAKGAAGRYEVIERRLMTGVPFDLAAAAAVLTPQQQQRPRHARSGAEGGPDAIAAWVRANAHPGYRHEPLRWMAKKLADVGQLDDAGVALVLETAEAIGLDGGLHEACAIVRSYGGPA
jgi:hypothetical protein